MNKCKAFTLIELLVVIAILGILVGLASPKWVGYMKDADVATVQSDVQILENVSKTYYIKHDDWPIEGCPDNPIELPGDYGNVGYRFNEELIKDYSVSTVNNMKDYVLSPNYAGGVFYLPGIEDRHGDYHYTFGEKMLVNSKINF